MLRQLPYRSKSFQPQISQLCQQIVDLPGEHIAGIVLFGAYARGDWIEMCLEESPQESPMRSAFDFHILMESKRYADPLLQRRLEQKIHKKVRAFFIYKQQPQVSVNDFGEGRAYCESLELYPCSLSVSIDSVSHFVKKYKQHDMFCCHLVSEGVLVYKNDSQWWDTVQLTLRYENNHSCKRDEAVVDEELLPMSVLDWCARGDGFLSGCRLYLAQNLRAHAIFQLHQALECYFNAVLLSRHGPKTKTHDLALLLTYSASVLPDVLYIFPRATAYQIRCFQLLQDAYLGARYQSNYSVNKEDAEYLMGCVTRMKSLVTLALVEMRYQKCNRYTCDAASVMDDFL